jgi:hypothetical protein
MELKIVLALFLMILFITLFILLLISNNLINNIKKNWVLHRCNPLMMPFAGLVGHNVATNFTKCIGRSQGNFMGKFLEPVNFNMNILGKVTSSISSSLNMTRGFIALLKKNMIKIFGSIFIVFLNIVIEIQTMTFKIQDMLKKVLGVVAVILYTMQGSMYTGKSVWNGPPGQVVRALCFHPNTKLKLKNGETYDMKDIPLDSVLKNGSIVKAVMNISNLTKEGKQYEKMYEMVGEEGSKLYVTGSHLVYDKDKSEFVKVSEITDNITDLECHKLSCLITDNHKIPIGDWTFHDWEDNNGSVSKDLNY